MQDPQIIDEIVKLKTGLAECLEANDVTALKLHNFKKEIKSLKS